MTEPVQNKRVVRERDLGVQVLLLEPRLLLSAAAGTDGDPGVHVLELCCYPVYQSLPQVRVEANAVQVSETATAQAKYPLTTLPAFSSRPAAPVKLYLDFNGDPYDHNTPAFDQDGDVATFSTAERAAIEEIWSRVAEKYSPFDINVTTVDPGALTAGKVMRVLIGGDGAWYGSAAGGLGYVGGFRADGYNTAWVFSKNMANGVARYTAEAVAHEAGHGFGLQHQSTWLNGTKTEEYNEGTAAVAPIMGVSYYSTRGLWWSGPSISPSAIQNDAAVLASALNGFGYRADDHPSTPPTAEPLAVSGGQIRVSGVIEKPTDADYFIVQSGMGIISLSLSGASVGTMLDAKLSLLSTDGRTLAVSDGSGLDASLTAAVAAGSYRIAVQSHGGYGDIGQYTLTGSVPTHVPNAQHPPSGLSASAVSNRRVALRWSDNSTSEAGFVIERQDDTGPWVQAGIAGKNATSFLDSTVLAARIYRYRVSAFGPGITVGPSNIVAVTTPTNAPSGLRADTLESDAAISLRWTDIVGESGYRIERSDDGITWVQVGTTSANTSTFSDSLISGANIYKYRVRAFNALGDSSPSNIASAAAPGMTTAAGLLPALVADRHVITQPATASWVRNAMQERKKEKTHLVSPDPALLEIKTLPA